MDRPSPRRASFTALLVILAGALLVAPLLPVGGAGRFAAKLIVVFAMASAVWGVRPGRVLLLPTVVVAVLTAAASAAQLGFPARGWIVVDRAASLLFVVLVVCCITRNVWREREVGPDTIVGGVAVYLLLAVAWSSAYQLLEFLVPGSLEVVSGSGGHWGPWEEAPGQYPRLILFSFVTLTTLGYGDVVPASPLAGILASLEAVAGPLYLTILIARLVGLHSATARGESPGRGIPEDS
jgi:hypothetical protein